MYVKAVDGELVKCDLPKDCLLVQLGEMFQFFSGGHLRATPHCVRSCPNPKITREQFAMFMNLHPEEVLTLPKYSLSREAVVNCPYLPEGIPELKGRLKVAKLFREFASNSFIAYLKSR